MKLILHTWGSNSDSILKNTLIEIGHEVTEYKARCEHYTKDLKFAQGLINLIHETEAEGVITYDYFPIISMVCNTTGILYYSWVYDSPHYTLFASTSGYSCNRIGCFDKALVERLNKAGIDTVNYLPLGVNWTGALDSKKDAERRRKGNSGDIRKFVSDVSFVGSLYTDAHNYYDDIRDEGIKSRAYEYVKRQCFEYERDYLRGFFEEEESESIRNILLQDNLLPGDEYIEDIEYIFTSHFLEKKVTVEERHILLNRIAGREYEFALYTGSDLNKEPMLKKVNRGIVDYHREMPLVFRESKINLNITLRSIKTGIPLRALDIMGCGGFLLSNYQEELKEYFREGEELVLFYDLEDCLEKIDYYLCHDEERKRIAGAGYEAVRARFNYRDQLVKLLEY